MCSRTLGNVDCWYLNKLVPLGGQSASSLVPTKVFSEASFLPAPNPQGSFKYNQFVKSCSKTSPWNPQADAIIFLRDDGRLLFPCSGKIGLCCQPSSLKERRLWEDWEEGGGRGAGDAVCCAKQQRPESVCDQLFCNFRPPLRAQEQKCLRRSPTGGYDHKVMNRPG